MNNRFIKMISFVAISAILSNATVAFAEDTNVITTIEQAEVIPEEPTPELQPPEPEPQPQPEIPKPVTKPKKFVNSSTKYPLTNIDRDIKAIAEHYKEIATLDSIGNSYEGRPIHVLKLGAPSEIKKPSILLMGNIHAREDFSSTLVMKMLDFIAYSYYDTGTWGNYNVKDILSQIDIYFIPVANPDGLNIAHNGIKASSNYEYLKKIQNIVGDDRWWKANGRGVDLNRNFDDGNWNIRQGYAKPSSENYKGAGPNSEPETKAIQKFCNDKRPLLAISYHTSGNLFYWADKDTHSIFKGHDTAIINRMKNITGYTVMPVSQNPKTFGAGFENWFKKRFNRFGICVELSPFPGNQYAQHSDDKFDSLVWNKAKFTGIQLAVEAMNIEDKMYNVYQNESYLKTFYTQAEAKQYAKQWKSSSVRRTTYDIYQGEKYLKTFYSQKEALNYAKLWTNSKIVSGEKNI